MFPQARLTDLHTCPIHGPTPILGVGAPTVLVGNLPAARVTDFAACPAPPAPVPIPNAIVKGSTSVIIMNMPAARQLDMCTHPGSMITVGFPTVLTGG